MEKMKDDVIYRQMAIDALDCINGTEEVLRSLPSVQPDTRSLEQIKWERDIAIQQLKDLGYSLGEKIRADVDTISRQALMKEFSDFVRASNNSDFARTPTWNDAVSLVGSMPSAQPTMGQVFDDDCVSRQAAIDAWRADFKGYVDCLDLPRDDYNGIMEYINEAPSVQPEITLESAIDYLHKIGWMQEHDRILTESVQPEIIRCKDCKWSDWYTSADSKRYCYCMETGNGGRTENDFCSYAERQEE